MGKAAAGSDRVAVIGAGIGGLVAAALLAARGFAVDVYESASGPGGKARQLDVAGTAIDAGPTVFTLRPLFESIFAECGASLENEITLTKAQVLARHAWDGHATLDLHDDPAASEDAIGKFAGAPAAAGYRRFRAAAAQAYRALEPTFLHAPRANPLTLSARFGLRGLPDLLALRPYESLWQVLGEYFADPRLRQLYARYATYCGSSPFRAPSTLMLIAHVEASGVWLIEGGLSALAAALERIARKNGARFHYGSLVTGIAVANGRAAGVNVVGGGLNAAQSVICNADPAALAAGLLGPAASRAAAPCRPAERSLSAFVWLATARPSGFPLARHNVFFSPNYPAEFADLAAGRPPKDPTIYVCALDREPHAPDGPERLQIIMNAPANGDSHSYNQEDTEVCTQRMLSTLSRAGLSLAPDHLRTLTPTDFNASFPSMGGALYGRASHGWAASFRRQGSRTRIPGLYCAGGSTHPGAGVPMAALSARLAVNALLRDRASTARSAPRATAGGMWTRSAIAAASASPSSASSAVSSRPIT